MMQPQYVDQYGRPVQVAPGAQVVVMGAPQAQPSMGMGMQMGQPQMGQPQMGMEMQMGQQQPQMQMGMNMQMGQPQPQYAPQYVQPAQPQYVQPQPQPMMVASPTMNYSNSPGYSAMPPTPAPVPAPAPTSPKTTDKPSGGCCGGGKDEPPKPKTFDTVEKVKLLFGVIMAIISMILGITAYAGWSEKTQDFNGIIANWKTTPILDVTFATTCPAGFSQDFGAQTYSTYTSYTVGCSGDNNSSCSTLTAQFVGWRDVDLRVCTRRGGDNALNRVRYDANNPCPAGYVACGPDSCFLSTDGCPVSAWVQQNIGTAPPAGNVTLPAANREEPWGTQKQLFVQMGTPSDLPIVEMQIRQGLPCIGQGPTDTMSSMSVCSDVDTSAANSFNGKSVTTTSSKQDPRYIALDIVSSSQFLGWQSAAIQIEGDGFPDNGLNWQLSYRREIQWSAACPRTRQDVNSIQDKVNSISTAQLVLMIVAILTAIFNLGSACCIYQAWTKETAAKAQALILRQDKCNICADLIGIIPNIVAIVLAYATKSFFQSMQSANCSDSTTSATFSYLATEITGIAGLNVAKFVLMTLFLFYRIYDTKKKMSGAT